MPFVTFLAIVFNFVQKYSLMRLYTTASLPTHKLQIFQPVHTPFANAEKLVFIIVNNSNKKIIAAAPLPRR